MQKIPKSKIMQTFKINRNLDSIEIHSESQFPVLPFAFQESDHYLLNKIHDALTALLGDDLDEISFHHSQIKITSVRAESLYLNEFDILKAIITVFSNHDIDIVSWKTFNIITRYHANIIIFEFDYLLP